MKKSYQDTEKFYRMVAQKQGWKVNWDLDLINSLNEGLTLNFNRYTYYLCPCRDTGGSRQKDEDIICPCRYALPDIQEYGHCYCGLYLDPIFFEHHIIAKSIPERRPLSKE